MRHMVYPNIRIRLFLMYMQRSVMKKLIISMLLSSTPLMFGLIGELIDDIGHEVHHVAHATKDLLRHGTKHEHLNVPTLEFKAEPNGALVYFYNVAPSDTGVMLRAQVKDDKTLELQHPDFTALLSFNTQNNMLKVKVSGQQEELYTSDHQTSQQYASASQELAFTLPAPIDIAGFETNYNDHTHVLEVFFAYKK